MNLPDSSCSFLYLYPLIHKSNPNVISLIFCEITTCHPYNTVSVLRYLFKNIVLFTHFITSATPTPWHAQVVSQNLHEQSLSIPTIQNFTLVTGSSAISASPPKGIYTQQSICRLVICQLRRKLQHSIGEAQHWIFCRYPICQYFTTHLASNRFR